MDVMGWEGHSLRRWRGGGCEATGGLGHQAGLGQPLSAGDKPLSLSPQSPGWGHGQSLRPDGMNTAAVRGCLAGCPEGAVQLVLNINFTAAQGRRGAGRRRLMQTACCLLELGEERWKLSTSYSVEGRPATSCGAWSMLTAGLPASPFPFPALRDFPASIPCPR